MTATRESWKCEPFSNGVAIPYLSQFTTVEFEKLRSGLVPEAMEDKWFAFYEEPHLFLHRSWTGQPVYCVKFHTELDSVKVVEALWATELAKGNEQQFQYEAQMLDFLISNLLLGKEKPLPDAVRHKRP